VRNDRDVSGKSRQEKCPAETRSFLPENGFLGGNKHKHPNVLKRLYFFSVEISRGKIQDKIESRFLL
jgi:hypothetical protein